MIERARDGETYSPEQASEHAAHWCAKRPAWVRICDMPEGYCDTLYVQWGELSPAKQVYWGSEYAYNEFASKKCKVPEGFISGKGEFFESVHDVPLFHNLMMVFRIGVKSAAELRAGKHALQTS